LSRWYIEVKSTEFSQTCVTIRPNAQTFVKEVINRQQDKNGFLRKATATAGLLVALTACEQQPKITDGTVIKKEHVEAHVETKPVWMMVGKLMTYDLFKVTEDVPEKWTVQIAQCSTSELPPPEKIKKDCKTNSFDVPQEVYNSLQIGQHSDFRYPK
jgi:Fe-S cluster assembly iron-binding protein IscA